MLGGGVDETLVLALAIKNIIKQCISLSASTNNCELIICYQKWKKTANFFISYNTTPLKSKINKTNIVYKFTCPERNCVTKTKLQTTTMNI